MRFLLVFVVSVIPALASAAPITFDLRGPEVNALAGPAAVDVNSFSLTIDGLTATLAAQPASFGGDALVLNQTASAFGVNVEGNTCGGAEDADELDNGCVGESIDVVFSHDVFLNSLRVSSFGATDDGTVTMGASSYLITVTGLHNLGNVYLTAGTPMNVAYTAGNGFSFDNFTVTAVPEPASLFLLGSGIAAVAAKVKRRRRESSEPLLPEH